MKLYYIHGFGSSLDSSTLQDLNTRFDGVTGLTYDHNEPTTSLKQLSEKLIDVSKNDDLTIIASSLGGWYAEQLTDSVVADYILYNPCTNPEVSLAKYGLSKDVLYAYKQHSDYIARKKPVANRTVVLSMDDEVVDPLNTLKYYKNRANTVQTVGGHRMTPENIEKIFEKVRYLENQIV